MNEDQWIDDLDALLDKISSTMGGGSNRAVALDDQLIDSLRCLTFALPSLEVAIQPVDDEAAFHRFIMGFEQDLGSPSLPHSPLAPVNQAEPTPAIAISNRRQARSPRSWGKKVWIPVMTGAVALVVVLPLLLGATNGFS